MLLPHDLLEVSRGRGPFSVEPEAILPSRVLARATVGCIPNPSRNGNFYERHPL